jgi:hypothetical protein
VFDNRESNVEALIYIVVERALVVRPHTPPPLAHVFAASGLSLRKAQMVDCDPNANVLKQWCVIHHGVRSEQ